MCAVLRCFPDLLSRFRVCRVESTLPRAVRRPVHAARPAACQGFRRLHMSHTVLIADDNVFVREALCKFFEQDEFDVCGEAENGKEAVDKAQELHPDLILLDLSMPVMNGLE